MFKEAPSIFFIGVARNCATFLPGALANLDRLARLSHRHMGLIVENDSTDDTKAILAQWAVERDSFEIVSLDGIGAIAVRCLRLEMIRNYCISAARQLGAQDYDLLLIMDLDDASDYRIDEDAFISATEYLRAVPSRAAVFPNQLGFYRDLWPLRHPDWFPVDCWEEVFDAVLAGDLTDQEAFDQTLGKRLFSILPTDQPLPVDSAFGGLGIYKTSFALNNPSPYVGSKVRAFAKGHKLFPFIRWEVCEHVHFNQGLRQLGGELIIMPNLINGTTEGCSLPAPHTFRHFIFR